MRILTRDFSRLECGTVNPEVTGSTPVRRASSFLFAPLYCGLADMHSREGDDDGMIFYKSLFFYLRFK